MATDTSAKGLERLIRTALAGHSCEPPPAGAVAETQRAYGDAGGSSELWSGYDGYGHCLSVRQLATAQRKMRRIVSCFVAQCGSNTAMMSAVAMRSTRLLPSTGST